MDRWWKENDSMSGYSQYSWNLRPGVVLFASPLFSSALAAVHHGKSSNVAADRPKYIGLAVVCF